MNDSWNVLCLEFCNELERDGDEHWLDAHTLINPTVDWVKLFKYIKLPHVDVHPSMRFEAKATSTQVNPTLSLALTLTHSSRAGSTLLEKGRLLLWLSKGQISMNGKTF